MKNKVNIALIVTLVILLIIMGVTFRYFNEMNDLLAELDQLKIAGSSTIIDDIQSFRQRILALSVISFLITCGVLIWNYIYNQNHDKTIASFENEKQVVAEELKKLKEELYEAYKKLEIANTMAERNTKFIGLIQQNDQLELLCENLITELCKELEASQGAFFIRAKNDNNSSESKDIMKLESSYAYHIAESTEVIFEIGEGLVGQVAKEGNLLNLEELPAGHLEIISGLGSSEQANLVLVPIKSDEKVLGILEVASFKHFSKDELSFLEQISQNISTKLGVLIN